MTRTLLYSLLPLTLPAAASAIIPQTPAGVLAGRVAGKPIECIGTLERDRESQMFADGSILYRGRGSTYWLNRPADCPAFRSDRSVTSITPVDALCRGDIIQVTQPTTGIVYGACALGAFVPYSRTK